MRTDGARTRSWVGRAGLVLAASSFLLSGTVASASEHSQPSNVCPPPSGNASFPDVGDGSFAEEIECLGGYGIADGYRDGEY